MASIDPIAEFRVDHRQVRDGLLALTAALQDKDVARAREILGNIDKIVGPHFRFEEEALYPALRTFLGEYVDDLLKEHDGVIATARACAALLQKEKLSDEEAREAAKNARALLVHVSNCDGLGILAERLTFQELSRLGEKLAAARKAGVSLLDWADTIRPKANSV